ncbi:GGDEF domain-containing protein [Micromonospora sp. WMMD1082]|uniref:GGDEF domain-containing protein n=1 Tax=Micromonospora sp. WMMD1082 TaxID=3016104 RepID=UPI002415EE12|nr:GGDEF domain-containing protein [Micromonospora sp. WMMD1082]MDG4795407.1 GGDEF domain-containing protein [Micromonospora sp. WMMD1082]
MSTLAQVTALVAAMMITAAATSHLTRRRTAARHRAAVAAALHTAHHDDLTGLGNRAGFHAALAVAGRPVAVILINLDRSRMFAARFGDRAFDQLLVLTAGRLRHAASAAGGQVFRLRRDEFAVVVDDRADAAGLAARWVAAVAEPTDIHLTGPPVTVTVTVTVTACAGVAVLAPHVDAERLLALAHADRALRAAKQTGRGHTTVFNPAAMRGTTDGGPLR